MFGSSSPFGQSAPFGSQAPFGQNNVANNPFAAKPFGAANTFGSQTGGSIFGSTSTGVFGQSSSPLSSTPAFGATTSSPAFGSSTPAFGSSSSSFGGSSVFGQKPFGSFGSSTQASPFGSSFQQQSQPAFGSSVFGSTPFGASSQPSFGGTSTPAFGSSTTPAFGAASTPGFGATTTPAFGTTPSPAFGSTGAAFGVASAPAFGSGGAFGSASPSVFGGGSAPAFGATTTPAFGAASTPTFGASSSPAFGASGGASVFGGSSSPSFNFGSSPSFGQSMPAFGSTPSPFGAPGSSLGQQATTPSFGSSGFGQPNNVGSRAAPYQPTTDPDSGTGNSQPAGKLESISAMTAYKDKSHEELRWEDYQRGDKGGPNPAGQPTSGASFGVSGTMSSPFNSSPAFTQSSLNPFTTSTQPNMFAPKPAPIGGTGLGTSTTAFGTSPFGSTGATTSSPFGSAPASASPFAPSNNAFGSNTTSIFNTSSSSAFGNSPFGSAPSGGTTSFGLSSSFNTQTPNLFQSTSGLGTGAAFGQTNSPFGGSAGFNSNNNNTNNSIFNPPSGGLTTNVFSSSAFAPGGQLGFNQSTSSLSTPFQTSLPAQTSNPFNFNNTGQTQSGGGLGTFGQIAGQSSANQSTAVLQPVAVTNPFGTLPAMPHMSIGNSGTSTSIQYGISSMPVVDKPAPVRVSSLLTSRHLSQRRIRLPARKYHPKNDVSRVPFFSDDDEAPSTPKADALFIPRENPRALIIRPIDQWPKSPLKEVSVLLQENGKTPEENGHHVNGSFVNGRNSMPNGNGLNKEQSHLVKVSQKYSGDGDDTPNQKGDSYITLSGHRAGEAAIVYEHGADIEAMMPKLRHSDYYTVPRIQELAAKERAEPGYCRHVKDFIVGRHGYGSIKFLGETDVRRLDLESLIQFNNREVIVYMDDSKKPPVGQGLNKPAEVTLLNIKCYDKKTGNQILEGSKIEKYKEMLKKKAEDQGAQFLSYDPANGEWKFRVNHFSRYVLHDDDRWDTS